jgi:L,D-transpeptidase YnhG
MVRRQFFRNNLLLTPARELLNSRKSLILARYLIIVLVLLIPSRQDSVFSQDEITRETTKHSFRIVVSVAEKKLRLYEQNGQAGLTLRKEYDVATAIKGLTPQPMGTGKITKIEFNPRWYPPPVTRAIFKGKGIDLPPVVPSGHPLNYMGPFKIHLSHCTSRGCFYRIHGNNDKSKIGKRVTGGCVRMYNEEGMDMAHLVPIGTKVIFVP